MPTIQSSNQSVENTDNAYDKLLSRAFERDDDSPSLSADIVESLQDDDHRKPDLEVVGHQLELKPDPLAPQRYDNREAREAEADKGGVEREMTALQFSSIQVTALKAVQCVLGSQNYGEMLLVPKADLVADSSKALADGTVVRRDEKVKVVISGIMRRLVVLAASPAPFSRTMGLEELDRTRAMLHKMAIERHAEENTNLSQLRGKAIFDH